MNLVNLARSLILKSFRAMNHPRGGMLKLAGRVSRLKSMTNQKGVVVACLTSMFQQSVT